MAQSEQVAVRLNEQGWEVLMTYFLCKPTDKKGGCIIDSRWCAGRGNEQGGSVNGLLS